MSYGDGIATKRAAVDALGTVVANLNVSRFRPYGH